MLKDIIELLNSDDWIVGDSDIDFAKGMYKLPSGLSEVKQIINRRNGPK